MGENFFIDLNFMAKGKDSDREDANISLELSLSLSNTTSSCTLTNTTMSLEKKSGSSLLSEPSSDPDNVTNDDISLELSLSLHPKPNDASTSRKRNTMSNPIAKRKYKRSKVETVSTELTLALDPWCIKKTLFKSDLGGNARLMLPSNLVEAHVLRYWNADQVARIEEGVSVLVWDSDTNTVHEMKLKRWNSNANVLMKKWVSDFVKRRNLMQGDEIGLYWDTQSSRFNFSVLSRAPMQ